MGRWLKNKIGRWRSQRMRTKTLRAMYRTYANNQALLDNGGTLPDSPSTEVIRRCGGYREYANHVVRGPIL